MFTCVLWTIPWSIGQRWWPCFGSKNFLGRPVSLLNFPAPILTTLPNIFMNTYQCPFSTCQQWQGVCMSVYSLISSTFKLDHGREIDITFGFFAKSSDSTSGHSAGCGVSFHQDQVLLIYFYLQNSTCRVFLPVREGRNEPRNEGMSCITHRKRIKVSYQ